MGKKMFSKTCHGCGHTFYTNISTAIYCGRCVQERRKERQRTYNAKRQQPEERTCPICGKTFTAPSKQSRKTYCDECRHVLFNPHAKGHDEAVAKREQVEKARSEAHWNKMVAEAEKQEQRHRKKMGLKPSGLRAAESAAKALGLTYGQYVARKRAGAIVEPVRAGNPDFDEWISKICGGRRNERV